MRRMRRCFFSFSTTSAPAHLCSFVFYRLIHHQQGFPIAHVQLPLPVQAAPSASPSAPAAAAGELEFSNISGGITIKGAGVEVEVST